MADKEKEHKHSSSCSCSHSHGDSGPITPEEFSSDAAAKSLVDALNKLFVLLKVIMVVLVLLFLATGIFEVGPDEQAFVLRFGKMRDKLYEPGFHAGLPSPIDEIIRIPVKKVQTVGINSFWYFMTDAEKLSGKVTPRPTLDPIKDGYCLTRNDSFISGDGNDYNIVHAKWELSYRIDYPEQFFRNVFYNQPIPGQDFGDVVKDSVDPMLKCLAEDAIVTAMVNYSIDEAIVSKSEIAHNVKRLLQDKLDQLESGMTVVAMQVVGRITWPTQVDSSFQASSRASQLSQKSISEAQGYAETLLSEAGGLNAAENLEKLKDENLDDAQRNQLFASLAGTSRQMLSEARTYRMKVVETAKANADYLNSLLPEYKKRPELVLQKIYQDAIEVVLGNADEKVFIPPTKAGKDRQMRVLINRDPNIAKKKPEQENAN